MRRVVTCGERCRPPCWLFQPSPSTMHKRHISRSVKLGRRVDRPSACLFLPHEVAAVESCRRLVLEMRVSYGRTHGRLRLLLRPACNGNVIFPGWQQRRAESQRREAQSLAVLVSGDYDILPRQDLRGSSATKVDRTRALALPGAS